VDDTIGTLAIDVTATVAKGAAADILTDFLVAAILL
jgi:plasmid replication initiation protein